MFNARHLYFHWKHFRFSPSAILFLKNIDFIISTYRVLHVRMPCKYRCCDVCTCVYIHVYASEIARFPHRRFTFVENFNSQFSVNENSSNFAIYFIDYSIKRGLHVFIRLKFSLRSHPLIYLQSLQSCQICRELKIRRYFAISERKRAIFGRCVHVCVCAGICECMYMRCVCDVQNPHIPFSASFGPARSVKMTLTRMDREELKMTMPPITPGKSREREKNRQMAGRPAAKYNGNNPRRRLPRSFELFFFYMYIFFNFL